MLSFRTIRNLLFYIFIKYILQNTYKYKLRKLQTNYIICVHVYFDQATSTILCYYVLLIKTASYFIKIRNKIHIKYVKKISFNSNFKSISRKPGHVLLHLSQKFSHKFRHCVNCLRALCFR
jgi:hypothetical protein